MFIKMVFLFGNFLGNEDEWIKYNNKMSFFSKEKLLSYFNDFEIMYFSEKKYIKDSISDKNKKWHIFEIYAKKKV